MSRFYNITLLCCLFSLTSFIGFSQQINLVRFNTSANYTAGSGVSVLINPTGIFELDNKFILELSNVGGAFTSPTSLTELNEFYVPAINGTLPSGLAVGTYKLRIRSTNPVLAVETSSFNVSSGTSIGIPKATSAIVPNSNFINCINCNNEFTVFGSLNRSDVATVGNASNGISSSNRNITICNYDAGLTYTINLISKIDFPAPSITTTPISHTNGVFVIPSNLGIGTHMFEIESKNASSISVYSIIFLFHGNATNLGNSSSEQICINENVTFTFDKTLTGIGRNYYGSKYKIDFGDGTINEYTHAQLLSFTTLQHIYTMVSCNEAIGYYIIKKELFNKGITNNCSNYIINGNGVTKNVNTSSPPTALFNLPLKNCINTSIFVDNISIAGLYGALGCQNQVVYEWSYKKPGDVNFIAVPSNSTWINSAFDLTIPASVVSIPGCWEIKLNAVNPDFCQINSDLVKTINIEAVPTPSFTNNPQSPICAGASIMFTNTSNVINNACQEFIYQWDITPITGTPATNNGYQFITPTNASSENANILFTQPGSYSIVLKIINSCGTFSSTAKIIEVFGSPSVTFNPNTITICDAAPAGYTINFAQTGTSPTYSSAPYAPTGYTWTVAGSGVTSADYSFVGGTNANNQFPQINFTAYKTYTITVLVDGNCVSSNQASFTFVLKEMPVILNTNLNQAICTGGTTNAINLLSNMPIGTVFNWVVTASNGITGFTSPGTGNTIPSVTLINPSNTSGTVNYTVTPSNNGCDGNPAIFTINVNPAPLIPTQNFTVCSGNNFTVPIVNNPPSVILPNGTTFTWTVISPTGISGTTNQLTPANAINQTLVNSTSSPINVVYNITASAGNSPNNCTYIFNLTVTVNPKPQIPNQTLSVCSGNVFTLSLINSPPSVIIPTGTAYSWTVTNPSGISGAFNQTLPGTTTISQTLTNTTSLPIDVLYNVTATSGSGSTFCSSVFLLTVTVNPAPSASITGNASVCQNSSSTPVTFTGLNGIAPYTFTYNINGGTSQTISTTSGNSVILNAPTSVVGTFSYCLLSVVDSSTSSCLNNSNNCVSVVINSLHVVSTQPTATQNICVGGSIAPLTVAYTGGVGTATYQWYSNTNNSNVNGTIISGATTSTFTPSAFNTAGTFYYYATITLSGNGCGSITSDTAQVIVVLDPIITNQALANQSLCQNSTPTDLTITVSGGIGSFSYQWYSNTSNANTGGTLINAATNAFYTPPTNTTGTQFYYCLVTQIGAGCSVTSAVSQVTIVPAPAITTQPVSSSVCQGGTPTALTVAYANGTGTASYQWFSNTVNSTSGATPISGATNATYNPPSATVGTLYYFCEITFTSGGCTNVFSNIATVVINEIPVVTDYATIVCSENLLTYQPSSGNGNTVPNTTTYTWNIVSMTPSGGVNGATNMSTPMSSFSQQLTNTTNNIVTVVYTVTPTAGICIGNSFTITLNVYPKPNVVFSIPNQTICNATSNSLVNLSSTISGNVTISWNATVPSGITGASISGTDVIPSQVLTNSTNNPLTIIYTASATFNNNGSSCVGPENSYTITVNPTFISSGVISNYNGFNVSTFGGSDGFINLTTVGGSGIYSYSWTGPNGYASTSEDISGLFAGTYTVIINDGFCLSKTLIFNLAQPPQLLVEPDLNLTINLNCFGDSNGAVGILITQGSISPYDYELYNSNGNLVNSIIDSTNLNPQFTGLIAGTYSIKVIDANGGIKTVSGLTVSQPNEIIIIPTITPITCYGANDASITLAVSGGTSPYQAQWNTLATGFSQNNLSAGTYSIIVTDNKGCTKNIVIIIPEAPIFTVNPVVTNISCNGANDGSIVLNFVGGIAPVNLVWSDGSTAGTTRNNLASGVYSVVITDAKPCTITRTFTILEPQLLILSGVTTNAINCTNANSGSINLEVSGGNAPYNYLWNNGSTTEDLSNIPPGNYAVTVTDNRGCTKMAQFSITRPNPILLTAIKTTTANCNAFTVKQNYTAQATGGVPPYQFSWSSGTVSGNNNEFMTTTQNGLFTLTATDASGCSASYSFNNEIPVLGNPTFSTSSFAFTTYGIYSILDPIQFTSTITGNYISVIWDFGDGTFSNELNPIHTYVIPKDYVVTLTVTYPLGCVYVETISLLIDKGYVLVVPTAFTPNGDNLNDNFRPVTKGLKNIRMDIYDTWGSLIFSETGDVLVGWDAKIKGLNAENGNYYSKVSAETFYGTIVNENRTFVLIK